MISRFHSKLTPASGYGSYGRTSAAMSVGSSRSKIGSAKRILAHNNANGSALIVPCKACYLTQYYVNHPGDTLSDCIQNWC